MIIRQETRNDYKEVFNVIESAFKDAEFADNTKQFLVKRLRKSDAFIPELSMVAEIDGKIVVHILMTKLMHYLVQDNSKDITVFSIYKDNKGDLWLGTHENGAYKFNGTTFEKFKL